MKCSEEEVTDGKFDEFLFVREESEFHKEGRQKMKRVKERKEGKKRWCETEKTKHEETMEERRGGEEKREGHWEQKS